MKTTAGPPDIPYLLSVTKEYENTHLVDNTRNLFDDRVYLFSGKDDSVVSQTVVQSLETYYKSYIPSSNIVRDYNFNAEHCFPTLNYGEQCTTLSSPYIGKCNFDGAKAALSTLYGNSLKAKTTMINANLMRFNQIPYWPDSYTSLAENGYIYVPTSCQKGETCHLHISLHGCEQTEDLIGNDYAAKIGMNEWAETNNIVILYPYVKRSPVGVPVNPKG
jgi:hypothetical protein